MENISLTSTVYFQLWELIKNNQYPCIISDTKLENITYENIQGKDIRQAMSYYIQEYENKNILLIIQHNTIDPIFSLLAKTKNITILDIHTWVFAWWEKSTLSQISAYSLQEYWFEVYSPIDFKYFKKLLTSNNWNTKKYFHINEIILPKDLSKNEGLPIKIQYTPEEKYNTTILTIGYPYIQVGQALQKANIQNITLLIYDNIILNEKAYAHIRETKNLMVIIDSKYPNIIKKNIQAQLYKQKIFWITLSILTPKYENLNTIFKEYQLQESEFDADGIIKQLQLN